MDTSSVPADDDRQWNIVLSSSWHLYFYSGVSTDLNFTEANQNHVRCYMWMCMIQDIWYDPTSISSQPESLESLEVGERAAQDSRCHFGSCHSAGEVHSPCCHSHFGKKRYRQRRETPPWHKQQNGRSLTVLYLRYLLAVCTRLAKSRKLRFSLKAVVKHTKTHSAENQWKASSLPDQMSDSCIKLQEEDLPAQLQQAAHRLWTAGVRQTADLTLDLQQLCS